jgi:hypothetical protein
MGFFKGDEKPLTHTIAYTLRGLLESSYFFEEELKLKTQKVVKKAAECILSNFELNISKFTPKLLPGRLDSSWNSSAKYSCLTGNAQMAIIWLKIYQLDRNKKYLDSAILILNELKKVHNLKSSNPGIRGGIAGSYPIWGSYMRFSYPNWAAKFYADALMLQEAVVNEIEQKEKQKPVIP